MGIAIPYLMYLLKSHSDFHRVINNNKMSLNNPFSIELLSDHMAKLLNTVQESDYTWLRGSDAQFLHHCKENRHSPAHWADLVSPSIRSSPSVSHSEQPSKQDAACPHWNSCPWTKQLFVGQSRAVHKTPPMCHRIWWVLRWRCEEMRLPAHEYDRDLLAFFQQHVSWKNHFHFITEFSWALTSLLECFSNITPDIIHISVFRLFYVFWSQRQFPLMSPVGAGPALFVSPPFPPVSMCFCKSFIIRLLFS